MDRTLAPQPPTDDSEEVAVRLEAIRTWVEHGRAGSCEPTEALEAIEGLAGAAEQFLTPRCCAGGVGVSANLEYLIGKMVEAWLIEHGESATYTLAGAHLLHHVERVLSDRTGTPRR